MIGQLTNHLWQSTVFAFAVALMAFAFRRNRAKVRYLLWLSVSLKFLIPFSLLAAAGARLWASMAAGKNTLVISPTVVSHTVSQFAQPFSETFVFAPSATSAHTMNWILLAAFSIWLFGFLAVVFTQLRSWLCVRVALRDSMPLNIAATIPIRSSNSFLEPGVVGFIDQVLLLPEGITRTLTSKQMEAVLAHEQAHARRHDNLTSAIHMVVEAVFWFHPLVWWVGARLVEERERACDEAVLSAGNQPQDYAEGILSVCKTYFESPLRCVSGVTGSDLKLRIRAILSGRIASDLTFARRAALTVAAVAAFAAPVLIGAVTAPNPSLLSSLKVTIQDADAEKFAKFVPEVVSIKRSNLDNNFDRWGMPPGSDTFVARNVTILRLLRLAYALGHGTEDNRVLGGPSWLNEDRYDIDAKVDPSVAEAIRKLSGDERDEAIHHILLAILRDRCRLAVHRDTKELPIYTLVVARGGPKLKPASADELVPPAAPNGNSGRGTGVWLEGRTGPLVGKAVTTTDLANMLQYLLSRTTVDKTGLTGKYDFTVKWNLDDTQPASAAGSSDEALEEHFLAAIQDQLGLKVQSSKGPVEVIVIDRMERPSGN